MHACTHMHARTHAHTYTYTYTHTHTHTHIPPTHTHTEVRNALKELYSFKTQTNYNHVRSLLVFCLYHYLDLKLSVTVSVYDACSVPVSCLEEELQSVKRRYPAVACHCLDVAEPELPALISQHQLVIW